MIYGLVQIVQDDASVLTHWVQGKDIPNVKKEDQQHRIQVAVARMIAAIAMAFGGLWALSILTFVITIPIKIALKLAVAVSFYALAHDIFVMSHNAAHPSFQQGFQTKLWGLFRGHEVHEEERARQFTHGTFLQPAWMWLYVNRNKIKELKT